MKTKNTRLSWVSIFALGVMSLLYQNCTPVKTSSSPEMKWSQTGNGGPYSGMAKVYDYFNSIAPCAVQDIKGKPLANTEIILKPNASGETAPHLARENCSDLIVPTVIAPTDLKFTASDPSKLSYKNITLKSQTLTSDFDIVAAQCPAGRTAIAGAVRTNLFKDSFDWTIPNVYAGSWYQRPGITTRLYSTIESLPAYQIERNDPQQLEFWRRPGQYFRLKPNTAYSFSFLAQPGVSRGANVNIFRQMGPTTGPSDEDVRLTFDFTTLQVSFQWILRVPGVSATITPFGSAYLCTVYFTTTSANTVEPWDIGLSSLTNGDYGQLGDNIVATAAQLVEVNQYCQ